MIDGYVLIIFFKEDDMNIGMIEVIRSSSFLVCRKR